MILIYKNDLAISLYYIYIITSYNTLLYLRKIVFNIRKCKFLADYLPLTASAHLLK